jgi:hypothetical protein
VVVAVVAVSARPVRAVVAEAEWAAAVAKAGIANASFKKALFGAPFFLRTVARAHR